MLIDIFSKSNIYKLNFLAIAFATLTLIPSEMDAQRLNRGGSRSGARSAPSRTASRPASRPTTRPSNTRQSNTRQSTSRPKTNTANTRQTDRKSSINGGSKKASDRKVQSSSDTRKANAKNKAGNARDNNSGDRNIGSNNNVNIQGGDRDVNINVDNSRHVNVNNRNNYVRASPYAYRRPPYHYGGFSFHCHFGYHYHPYRPYYWGPAYHPWGFFVATLAATAIIVSINNQKYHYDEGVFYEESDGGYTAVEAPNGAVVGDIPEGAEQVTIEQNVTNNYYYGGTYYEEGSDGYTVVPPTAGSVVTNLPEGAEEVKMGDVTYVKFGDTYYQPVQVEGEDKYEVAQIEETEEGAEGGQ